MSSSRQQQVVALVPCKDGGSMIARTVSTLLASGEIDQVVVVDDGSVDTTAARARSAGAHVIRLDDNVGKGAALTAGLAAVAPDAVVLLVDADTEETASGALGLLRPILEGTADLVIGALPGAGRKGGFGTVRSLATWGIEKACGFRARAPLSGQRAILARHLQAMSLAPRFGVEVGMTIDAVRKDLRVVEIDVEMDHLHRGRKLDGFIHRGRQGKDVVRALLPRLLPTWLRRLSLVACVVMGVGVLVLAGDASASGVGSPLPTDHARASAVFVKGLTWQNLPQGTFDAQNVVAAGSVAWGEPKESAPHWTAHVPLKMQGVEIVGLDQMQEVVARASSQTVVIAGAPSSLFGTSSFEKGAGNKVLRPVYVTAKEGRRPGSPVKELTSPSTQVPGLIDSSDVIATQKQLTGALPKTLTEGHPATALDHDFDQARAANLDWLARSYDGFAPTFIWIYVLGQVAFFLWALRLSSSGRVMAFASLFAQIVAGVPLASFVVRGLQGDHVLGLAGWSALMALTVGIIVFMCRWVSRSPLIALRRIFMSTILVLVVDAATGSHLQSSGLFGSSPLLAARYHGLGNPATAVLLSSVILWSATHVQLTHDRRSAVWHIGALFVLAAAAVGLPTVGDDAGGLLGFVVAGIASVFVFAGRKIRPLSTVGFIVAAVVALLVAAGIDHARGVEDETHIGHLLDGGGTAFVDTVTRKIDNNIFGYGFPWTIGLWLVVAVLFVGLFTGRWQGALPKGSAERRGVALAAVGATVLYLLNDSGIVVLALLAVLLGPFILEEHRTKMSLSHSEVRSP